MERFFLVVAVYLGIVVYCNANTLKMEPCPRVTVMKNIDFDKFLGEWYVVQRYNPMATCAKVTLEKNSEGTYIVNETSKPLGISFGYNNQYRLSRKLKFLRNDTNSIFRVERNFVPLTLRTFGVVDTDYDNYAIIWGCDPVLFGSVQNVDVLSRQQEASEDILTKVRETATSKGIDVHYLQNVTQNRCGNKSDEATNEIDKSTNNMTVDES